METGGSAEMLGAAGAGCCRWVVWLYKRGVFPGQSLTASEAQTQRNAENSVSTATKTALLHAAHVPAVLDGICPHKQKQPHSATPPQHKTHCTNLPAPRATEASAWPRTHSSSPPLLPGHRPPRTRAGVRRAARRHRRRRHAARPGHACQWAPLAGRGPTAGVGRGGTGGLGGICLIES